MNFIVTLLYILPGFITEFFYQKFSKKPHHDSLFIQTIRCFISNIFVALFGWLVIYFWKCILHDWPMITSLSQFWYKALNEPFYAKYALVVFVFAVLLGLLYALIANIHHFKEKKCCEKNHSN